MKSLVLMLSLIALPSLAFDSKTKIPSSASTIRISPLGVAVFMTAASCVGAYKSFQYADKLDSNDREILNLDSDTIYIPEIKDKDNKN